MAQTTDPLRREGRFSKIRKIRQHGFLDCLYPKAGVSYTSMQYILQRACGDASTALLLTTFALYKHKPDGINESSFSSHYGR